MTRGAPKSTVCNCKERPDHTEQGTEKNRPIGQESAAPKKKEKKEGIWVGENAKKKRKA